jgi:hypothetical protein
LADTYRIFDLNILGQIPAESPIVLLFAIRAKEVFA